MNPQSTNLLARPWPGESAFIPLLAVAPLAVLVFPKTFGLPHGVFMRLRNPPGLAAPLSRSDKMNAPLWRAADAGRDIRTARPDCYSANNGK